ncbi:hypothetical protein NL676_002006 [Syzygium grande]|nr:hypothetical protein NL676_002006 [Syzygium grande]
MGDFPSICELKEDDQEPREASNPSFFPETARCRAICLRQVKFSHSMHLVNCCMSDWRPRSGLESARLLFELVVSVRVLRIERCLNGKKTENPVDKLGTASGSVRDRAVGPWCRE